MEKFKVGDRVVGKGTHLGKIIRIQGSWRPYGVGVENRGAGVSLMWLDGKDLELATPEKLTIKVQVLATPLKKKINSETRFGTGPSEMLISRTILDAEYARISSVPNAILYGITEAEPEEKFPWYGELGSGPIFRYDAHGEDGVCVKGLGAWLDGATRLWEFKDTLTPCDPPEEETFAVGDTVELTAAFGRRYVYVIVQTDDDFFVFADPTTGSRWSDEFEAEFSQAIKLSEMNLSDGVTIRKLTGEWKFE